MAFSYYPSSALTINFNSVAFWWVTAQVLCAVIFYMRFIKDKHYHAMYIIEAFIATKKLLKTSSTQDKVKGQENPTT